ncbi:MAG: polymer-forming cytoskeletal protein [Gammaproteobacteria bacterium]
MFERGKKQPGDQDSPSTAGGSGPASRPAPNRRTQSREEAVIGPSIHIDGDVRGEEDLVIQGEVSGTVQLLNNSLTVGRDGKVNADVHAQAVFVDGHVEGDLVGTERVCIRETAQVRGNVTSPRVSLEDGARFKGSIEMDPEALDALLGRQSGAKKSAAKPSGPVAAKTGGEQSSGKSRDLLAEAKTGSGG